MANVNFADVSAARAASEDMQLFFWGAVRADLIDITRNTRARQQRKLWPSGFENPFVDVWDEIASSLLSTEKPKNWDFWIDWYQAALDGRPMLPSSDAHWEMLAEIFEVSETSRLKEEDWEKGADHVNPIIREIYLEWQARFPFGPKPLTPEDRAKLDDVIQKTPFAHDITLDGKTQHLVAVEIDTPDLDQIITSTRQDLKDFTARCRKPKMNSNIRAAMATAYAETIQLLRSDLRRHKAAPFTLFEKINQARLEFEAIARTEGFADDPAHLRLIDGLQRRAEEICAAAPSVLETERERVRVRVELYTQQQKFMALRLCAGMHNDSQGELRATAALAVQIILDPDRNDIERRNAWYFLTAVGPRGARAMRDAGVKPSSPKDAKTTLEKIAETGDKLAKVDKGVDAIQEIGTEGKDWVTEVITQVSSGNWFGLGS